MRESDQGQFNLINSLPTWKMDWEQRPQKMEVQVTMFPLNTFLNIFKAYKVRQSIED